MANFGASSPEEYGDYYAWGEISSGKGYYELYKWRIDKGEISWYSKYWVGDKYADNKYVLDLYDDAARAKWGSNWRMSTKDEVNELVAKCTWIWMSRNGVNGYKVVAKWKQYIFASSGSNL